MISSYAMLPSCFGQNQKCLQAINKTWVYTNSLVIKKKKFCKTEIDFVSIQSVLYCYHLLLLGHH